MQYIVYITIAQDENNTIIFTSKVLHLPFIKTRGLSHHGNSPQYTSTDKSETLGILLIAYYAALQEPRLKLDTMAV